jgi:basic amino acid/polyamine antiporter, APA family
LSFSLGRPATLRVRVEQALPFSRRGRTRDKAAYRRILVPVIDREISEQAMAIACRLAAERKTSVTALGVIEVPVELPLNAHMFDQEEELKPVLAEASAIAELYGVGVEAKTLRGRRAGETIVEEAKRARSEIIVLSAPRKLRASRQAPVFGSTVDYVLKHAPCRVMVAAAPAAA